MFSRGVFRSENEKTDLYVLKRGELSEQNIPCQSYVLIIWREIQTILNSEPPTYISFYLAMEVL